LVATQVTATTVSVRPPVVSIPHDPYTLPNAWVNIEVWPENGNFAVTMSAESFQDNLMVLDRASRHADEHVLASRPEDP
jgi:hypothetical protein